MVGERSGRGSSVEESEGGGKSSRAGVMEGLVADAGSFWSSRGEQWMSWPRKDEAMLAEAMLAEAREDEATLSSLMTRVA